jgi:hypothetical protein
LTGDPPFIISTTYECTTSRPIWALIFLWSEDGEGTIIRDPERRNRVVGPASIRYCTDGWEDEDFERYEIEDSLMLRMEPGRRFSTCYKMSTEPREPGFGTDMKCLKEGKSYGITLRVRKWRWMYEDEMGELGWNGRRELLATIKPTTWRVDCSTTFTTV